MRVTSGGEEEFEKLASGATNLIIRKNTPNSTAFFPKAQRGKKKQLSALLFGGLLSHSQRLFYQIGGESESVGLSDRLLEFTCIIPIALTTLFDGSTNKCYNTTPNDHVVNT
jgi:hypothetical protein